MNERDFIKQFTDEVRDALVIEPRKEAEQRFAQAEPPRKWGERLLEPEFDNKALNEFYKEAVDTLIKSVPALDLIKTMAELTQTFVEGFVEEANKARRAIQEAHPLPAPDEEGYRQEDLQFSPSATRAVAALEAMPKMFYEGFLAMAEKFIKDKISSLISEKLGNIINKGIRAVGRVGADLLGTELKTVGISNAVNNAKDQLQLLLVNAYVKAYVKPTVNNTWDFGKGLAKVIYDYPNQAGAIAEAFLRIEPEIRYDYLPALVDRFLSQKKVDEANELVELYRKGWGSRSARYFKRVNDDTKMRMAGIVKRLLDAVNYYEYVALSRVELGAVLKMVRGTLNSLHKDAGLPKLT